MAGYSAPFMMLFIYFQSEVVCSPKVDEYGGIPAGCQCDKDNNIWIADMRLGILKMDTAGNYEQVKYSTSSHSRASDKSILTI